MSTFRLENAIELMHVGLSFPPAIVGWNRLEGRPRTVQFDRALRAEVRDALWFLTRQWQFGEFNGEDAGSPVEARTAVRVDPIQHYAVRGEDAVAYDPTVALEAHVERESVAFDLVIHSQVTRYFWRLIAGLSAAHPTLKARYLAIYPLRVVSGVEDEDAKKALQLGRPRVLDAADLLADVASGGHATKVDEFAASVPSASDRDELKRLGNELRAWFFRQFSQPTGEGDDAWKPRYLEYQFAIATDAADRGQSVLVADQYTHGHIDWFAFDLDASPDATLNRKQGEAVPSSASVTPLSFIPTPVSFGGMPSHRYWEMESRQIEFADIDAHTTDLGKLLLTEFALVYGNDWCVIPYELPVGSLSEVVGILVSDDFQEQSLLLPAGRGLDDRWQRWSMFTLSRSPSAGQADTRFLMVPAVTKLLEGEPLEKVHFLRDEMANMAWGVERVVPSQLGIGIDGHAVAVRVAALTPPPPPLAPTTAPVGYVLGTEVPYNWIPFIPVHVPGSSRSVQLQRAQMPRPPGVSVGGHSHILAVKTPYYINEEEIPRSGKLVTRGYQRCRWLSGATLTWIGRRATAGRGEGSSGLAFDQLAVRPRA